MKPFDLDLLPIFHDITTHVRRREREGKIVVTINCKNRCATWHHISDGQLSDDELERIMSEIPKHGEA
jgi:hypothetical protein